MWASAFLALTTIGCASGPEVSEETEAIVEASIELSASREAGDAAANDRASYKVPIRHNPSRCPCPRFEIWAYGTWMRVWIDGSPAQLEKLEAFARGDDGDESQVRGVLTDVRRPSERKVSYPVFELK